MPDLRSLPRLIRRHRRPIAAVLLGVAVWCALAVLRPAPPAHRPTAVVAHPVAAGSALSADDLAVVEWPLDGLAPDAVADPAGAVGRVAAAPLAAGTPLTASALMSPLGLAAQTAAAGADLVALPVRLGDAAAAALVAPGDHVDVWATGDGPAASPRGATAARVAAGAVVLAVPRAGGSGLLAGSSGGTGAVVVLGITEGQVPALAGAAATARITLALRPK